MMINFSLNKFKFTTLSAVEISNVFYELQAFFNIIWNLSFLLPPFECREVKFYDPF